MGGCLNCVCKCPQRPEDGIGYLGAGLTGSCEPPCVGDGNQTGLRQEQCALLIAELPLLHPDFFLMSAHSCLCGPWFLFKNTLRLCMYLVVSLGFSQLCHVLCRSSYPCKPSLVPSTFPAPYRSLPFLHCLFCCHIIHMSKYVHRASAKTLGHTSERKDIGVRLSASDLLLLI